MSIPDFSIQCPATGPKEKSIAETHNQYRVQREYGGGIGDPNCEGTHCKLQEGRKIYSSCGRLLLSFSVDRRALEISGRSSGGLSLRSNIVETAARKFSNP